jgi:hypothetical protein
MSYRATKCIEKAAVTRYNDYLEDIDILSRLKLMIENGSSVAKELRTIENRLLDIEDKIDGIYPSLPL